MSTLLELRGVEKRYDNGTLALERVDLSVGKHEFVSILGPSGCDKNTALNMIAGFSPVTAGSIGWPNTKLEDGGDHAKDISLEFNPSMQHWPQV